MSWMRRVAPVLVGGAALMFAPPAGAAEPTAISSAALGSVDVTVDGQHIVGTPIAPCAVAGPTTGHSNGSTIDRVAEYGAGDTACARGADGTANASAAGRRFEFTLLERWGGPKIRVRSYGARCATVDGGSNANVEFDGVSGVELPQNVPANYRVRIPGKSPTDPVLAEVIANELVVPSPPDGSLTTHTLHIRLFPDGNGPASGDLLVGTASCDPYS